MQEITEELEYKVTHNNLEDLKAEAEAHNKTSIYYSRRSIPTRASLEHGIIVEKETGMPIATVSREKILGNSYRHNFQWHPDFLKIHPGVGKKSFFNRFDLNTGSEKINSKADVALHVHQMLNDVHQMGYQDPIIGTKNENGSIGIFHADHEHGLGRVNTVQRGYSKVLEYEPSDYIKKNLSDLQIKNLGHPGAENQIHAFAMRLHKEFSAEKPYAVGSHSTSSTNVKHRAYTSKLSAEDLSKEHEKTLENAGHEITRTSPVTFEARHPAQKNTILSHAIGSRLHVHTFRENPEEYSTEPLSDALKNS